MSQSIYAIMGAEIGDYDGAYRNFLRAARVDLDDNRGNTALGIHGGSLGGTWQAAINGFAGMRIRKGKLTFDPHLPEKWEKMEFKVNWHGKILNVRLTKKKVEVKYSLKRN